MASAAVLAKAVVLFFIDCLFLLPLFVVVCVWSLFCYALLCVLSSFAIISLGKRELVVLLLLSCGCYWFFPLPRCAEGCSAVWSYTLFIHIFLGYVPKCHELT